MEKIIYEKEKLPIPVLKGHEDWLELYDQAWQLAFRNIHYTDRPGWKTQLYCAPGYDAVWMVDSSFMTLFTNYSNDTISAMNNLDNLYYMQRKSDGRIGMAYRMSTEAEAFVRKRINPPLPAWMEWNHYVVTGDASRFERVLPALEGLYQYIENTHRRACGLYWFEDPDASAMDWAPRGGYPAEKGSDICHVDLACQQALAAGSIAAMNGILQNTEKEAFYTAEHRRICGLINDHHWSERAGFYFDVFARDSINKPMRFLNTKTCASFWALICGCAKGERRERMVQHLLNEEEFNTKVPFATLSRDDPNYDPLGGGFLGDAWAAYNYLVLKGITDSGYGKLAREAAARFLTTMSTVAKDAAFGGIWEAYAPEALRPSIFEDCSQCKANFVGWSGVGPITILIEYLIGLRFHAPDNTVVFDIYPGEIGGLRNMKFCGGKVSIECVEYHDEAGKTRVTVETEHPFTLVVKTEYLETDCRIEVSAGKHVLFV